MLRISIWKRKTILDLSVGDFGLYSNGRFVSLPTFSKQLASHITQMRSSSMREESMQRLLSLPSCVKIISGKNRCHKTIVNRLLACSQTRNGVCVCSNCYTRNGLIGKVSWTIPTSFCQRRQIPVTIRKTACRTLSIPVVQSFALYIN